MALSKRVKRTLVALGVLAVALPVGLHVADNALPPIIRHALPATATDVQQYYDESANLNGDFARCLRARMPEAEMPQFAAKLGLTQRYRTGRDENLPVSFNVLDAPAWWQPPDTLDGAYFKYTPGKEAYFVAAYRDGHLYFLATAW